MSNLLASLGHAGRRRVVLSHILNTQTLTKTDEQQKKVLSKCTAFRWATVIAILGHVQPVGHGLDTPSLEPLFSLVILPSTLDVISLPGCFSKLNLNAHQLQIKINEIGASGKSEILDRGMGLQDPIRTIAIISTSSGK